MPNEVIVYTATGCPHCQKVKKQLEEWNIPYEERNVSEHREYFEELRSKRIFGTPATFINGKLILGFQPEKMKERLQIHSQENERRTDSAAQPGEENSIFQPADESIFADVYDFVSIGAGPAGASAAVYAARAKLKTLVIDKAPAAGTLALTHKIANYPGVRKELTGYELLTEMHRQAKDFGATFVRTTVLSVDFSDPEVKKIEVPEGTVRAKSVFIAVGAKAPGSKIKGEEQFVGRGVSYCSTCDAAFFENKSVVVVGDNEEALHEAATLAKFCREVKFLIPAGKVKGQADLADLESLPNVTIYKKYRVKEIQGDTAVERIIVADDERKEQVWETDGVFIYLTGMKPGTDFLGDAVLRDKEGYIVVDEHLRTNVDGVFAGGDARRTPVKQAVISAADGCIAALGADQHVNRRKKMLPQYN